VAVLEGDPIASSGDFTFASRCPPVYRVRASHAPTGECDCPLGILKVGMGGQIRRPQNVTFGGGSFAYLDPSMHHYAMASVATVIQIHGMSPVKLQLHQSGQTTPTDKK